MDALHERYTDAGFDSVFIYTREAHPGEKRGHHRSMDQKLAAAREMVETLGIGRRMLVDDLVGTAHRAYGCLPNMAFVVARGGRLAYRASWTDARTIGWALENLADAASGRREGRRVRDYFMEMNPQLVVRARPFFDGLLAGGGERAVREYIDAMARVFGESTVKTHRRYWEEHLAGGGGGSEADGD